MTYIVFGAIVIGVAALIGGAAMIVIGRRGTISEERLSTITQGGGASAASGDAQMNLLTFALTDEDDRAPSVEQFVSKFFDLRPFIEQSGVAVKPSSIVLMSIGLAVVGAAAGMFLPMSYASSPMVAVSLGVVPITWVFLKRKSRLGNFAKQLPEAMELLARSLRAGHSLADGINLVSDEMADPIATEFRRCYEQQNLGIPLEESLEEMTERVPNLDLRFFVTAMVLQRQTGGDAAEILDKIGKLIRERFQIKGQIKALTGEGRLSGIVLLALPILLAFYMYFRNPEYLMLLVTDPLGQKMVLGAIIAQILGALTIKKIVDIKV
ncbi:MAG: type II secretion system F family protein [Planctomycetes bacterium]|nr:type II secretion system F family protein [Planctomycetota bacterium]MBL7039249.1 type II secretion system F family protein [Pirellulaceae bacterium]